MYSRREGGLGWREISALSEGEDSHSPTVHYFGCVTFASVTRCITDEEFYRWRGISMEVVYLIFFSIFIFFFLFCTTLSNLGIMELFYAFCTIIRLWMAAQRPLATE